MTTYQAAALTVRFLCELAMLAALAYSGFDLGTGISAWLLGVGLPLLAALIWGTFVAPKARWPPPTPARLAIEGLLFGTAVAGLLLAGEIVLGVVLGIAAGATSILNAVFAPAWPVNGSAAAASPPE